MRYQTAVLLFAAVLPSWSLPLKPISSAEVCGQCHRSIVEAWKESAHARAADSRLFQDAMTAAQESSGDAARKTCLRCHAPIAGQTGDLQLDRKVSWEGVTCDYCHSIRDVTLGAGNPQPRLEYSLVKSGPIKDAVSGVHSTAYSPIHVSSQICAPCHEYRNSQGFPVLTTFSEWQASRYGKENRNCQSCHMGSVAGNVAEVRLARTPQTKINLHRMPGSRSVAMLNQTVKTAMTTTREGNNVKVTIKLTNTAAGHDVPTGSPLRQLILDVEARPVNGSTLNQSRVYARTLADATGKPVADEHFAFLKAARLVSDTRLAPEELRKEEFQFAIPWGTPTEVKATLSYFYSPTARSEQRRVTIRVLRSQVN